MKFRKILILFIIFTLIGSISYAGTISRHTTYSTNSEVTATNLNGNFDNILNEVNGGLDNTNMDTSTYRLLEILGALPSAGTQGRTVYLTTDNTLNFDTGSAFVKVITVSGTATQGDMIYYDGSSWARLTGGILQVVNTMLGTVATGTTTIPADNSIPEKTEGDEYFTRTITPTSATNKLRIDVVINLSTTAAATDCPLAVALFQDDTTNALAAGFQASGAATTPASIAFTHYMTAGTASSTTFKVRAGARDSGTTTVNGISGAVYYGGIMASGITITEIAA